MRASAPFYRRVASPLHATRAGVAIVWVLSLIAAALLLYHPLALLALLRLPFPTKNHYRLVCIGIITYV